MPTKTYDCYVRLSYVNRDERLLPASRAYRVDDQEYLPSGDWHDLVNDSTIAIWLVERTSLTHATDLLLAHLAGHAPVGTKQLYDSAETRQTRQSGIEPVSNVGREGKYLTKSGIVDIDDL